MYPLKQGFLTTGTWTASYRDFSCFCKLKLYQSIMILILILIFIDQDSNKSYAFNRDLKLKRLRTTALRNRKFLESKTTLPAQRFLFRVQNLFDEKCTCNWSPRSPQGLL
jgi:hypothetical protein